MNKLKTKVDDLDTNELKIVHVDMRKLSHVVIKETVKKTVCNKLNIKGINLENKIPDTTNTLIHINEYNIDKQSLEGLLLKV